MADRYEPDDRDEVAREIRTHLELEAEDRMAEGLSEEQARYAARRAFGSVSRTREDVRALWTWRWLDEGIRDVRLALRTPAGPRVQPSSPC
jgi:macrolide transport system ATP-binding/permease protein